MDLMYIFVSFSDKIVRKICDGGPELSALPQCRSKTFSPLSSTSSFPSSQTAASPAEPAYVVLVALLLVDDILFVESLKEMQST